MADSPLALHSASPAELQERVAAERAGIAFLVYRNGDGRQCIFALDSDRREATIGRGAGSDLCLAWDHEVSRVHAALQRAGDEWTLEDDGLSRNGSFVNGERVRGRRRLADGDTIRVGDTSLAYRLPVLTRDGTTVLSSDEPRATSVTDAQRRVLLALAKPFKHAGPFTAPAGNHEIAAELVLSVDAVKTHMRTLFRKFDVEDVPQHQKRTRLVELAFRTGVIDERDL